MGNWVQGPHQILEDKLTLLQLGRADYTQIPSKIFDITVALHLLDITTFVIKAMAPSFSLIMYEAG
jgi:hypothetical protein